MRTLLIAATWLALSVPLSAGAQPVAVGERVRVRQTNDARFVATLVELGPTGLRLRTEGADISVTPERIRTIERSLGRQRRVGRNFLITTALSALTLGTILIVTDTPTCTEGFGGCAGAGGSFVIGAVGGAIIGAPIGLIVGLTVRSEQWETASLPQPVGASNLRAPPTGGRVSVEASLAVGTPR